MFSDVVPAIMPSQDRKTTEMMHAHRRKQPPVISGIAVPWKLLVKTIEIPPQQHVPNVKKPSSKQADEEVVLKLS